MMDAGSASPQRYAGAVRCSLVSSSDFLPHDPSPPPFARFRRAPLSMKHRLTIIRRSFSRESPTPFSADFALLLPPPLERFFLFSSDPEVRRAN